jgi:F420-non-reducing hydrogenase iron-sulfur subunit
VGNYDAIVTVHVTRKIMEVVGVKPERVALDWASAAEAPLFVELITGFTKEVKKLGPLGQAEGMPVEALNLKLLAARAAMKSVKLRTRFARLAQDLRDGNSHTPEVIEAKMAEKVNEAIVREIAKQEKAIMESEEQSSKRLAQTT